VPDPDRLRAVRRILHGMFPHFSELDRDGDVRIAPRRGDQDEDKRISDSSLISAYFAYKLPGDLFSSRAVESFLRKFEKASEGSRNAEFFSVFDTMQKGDPRRSDFLGKLSDRTNTMSLPSAEHLAHACMIAADKLIYDSMFVATGEAGHALRILIRVASRLHDSDSCFAFLSKCIAEATDDTMALRIQTVLSKPGQDFNLGVSFGQLFPSFTKRMRLRYGRDVDVSAKDLTSSDPEAFNLWGWADLSKEGVTADPDDRAIQRDFWLRYIGESKSRLAYVFRAFILPNMMYEGDPTLFVENKIPVADLKNLYERLPDDPDLPEVEQKSLKRLGRLLNGEFKNGIGIGQYESEG
jgi:hypothetical protein